MTTTMALNLDDTLTVEG